MSLSKFLSLITSKKLYFCQLKILQDRDPFEGRFPERNYAELRRLEGMSDAEFRAALRIEDDGPVASLRNALRGTLHHTETHALSLLYVNCWHINSVESAFLWKTYASEEDGVAIMSTVGQLCRSLGEEPSQVFVSTVSYGDEDALLGIEQTP